jgi:cytochrome oxidase Cu insertion factor (SCO1/SenC/PrrC family)
VALGPALVLILTASSAIPASGAALPHLGPAPNFALTTAQNDRMWLTQLRPRAVVLTFGCTRCGACPSVLPALSELAAGLGEAAGRRVFFVLVGVDARADTPTALRTFARSRRLDPPAWLLLSGTPAEVEVVARRYDVVLTRDPDGHTSPRCLATLIDGAGQLRAVYPETALGRLRGDLASLLAKEPAP